MSESLSRIANTLISWYLKNKRELPWREITDPYSIWLSEIILQQTRVQQGLPYYNAFISNFPTVQHLANASEKEILSLWQGLGYYSRARNLHKTAQLIQEKYHGVFPETYKDLLELKGVGPYTAAAIASFAYQEQVAVVDGNVYRVLARIFGIYEDISQNATKKIFADLAQSLIPAKKPDLFNQAIMEFGALYCTSTDPDCEHCVFASICIAKKTGDQRILPVKTKKLKKQERFFQYFVIQCGDALLMKERGPKDIWQGMFEFLLVETKKPESLSVLLVKTTGIPSKDIVLESATYKHILSHQILHTRFIHIKTDSITFKALQDTYQLQSVNISQLMDTPMPVLLSRFLSTHKI